MSVLIDDSHGSSNGRDEEARLESNAGGTGSRHALDGTCGGSDDDLGGSLRGRRGQSLESSGLNGRKRGLGGRGVDRGRVHDSGGGGVHNRRHGSWRGDDWLWLRGGLLRLLVGAVGNISAALGDGDRGCGGGSQSRGGLVGGRRVGGDEGRSREGEDSGEAHLDVRLGMWLGIGEICVSVVSES